MLLSACQVGGLAEAGCPLQHPLQQCRFTGRLLSSTRKHQKQNVIHLHVSARKARDQEQRCSACLPVTTLWPSRYQRKVQLCRSAAYAPALLKHADAAVIHTLCNWQMSMLPAKSLLSHGVSAWQPCTVQLTDDLSTVILRACQQLSPHRGPSEIFEDRIFDSVLSSSCALCLQRGPSGKAQQSSKT